MKRRMTDPGILEIVGGLLDLLGLAEMIQRILPIERLKVQRKHRTIGKSLDAFGLALDDARAALRVLSSTLNEHLPPSDIAPSSDHSEEPLPRIAFSIPREELAVYRRGVEQLQSSIQKMTKIGFDLEAAATGISDEVQRYYKISQAGNPILSGISDVLDDNPEQLPELVRRVEEYLSRCSTMLEERDEWLES